MAVDAGPAYVSFCSGVGGLDLGLRLALPTACCVALVEREVYAVAVLAARMQDGSLDPAPIWNDLWTFPADEFRGRVDLCIGGIPCQPFSVAGSKLGVDDERHLWPGFWRAVRDMGCPAIFVENVPGLLVRGADAILGDMAEAGWAAEWGVFSAAEVGASHLRERFFLLAHAGSSNGQSNVESEIRAGPRLEKSRAGSGYRSRANMAHAAGGGGAYGPASAERRRRPPSAGDDVVYTCSPGFKQAKKGIPVSDVERSDRFPPGPGELHAWRAVPDALKPALCTVADGPAGPVDLDRATRTQQLRALGNGVVPMTAALAFRTLSHRLGLTWGRAWE